MIAWLNENLGADAATYIGTGIGIVGLFWGGSKVLNLSVNKAVNEIDNSKTQDQTLNVGSGNGFQSGGDMNVTIGSIHSPEQEEEKAKKSHDLRIIEKIVELLPYEDTLHHVDLSYISGMPYELARSLDRVEDFNGPKNKIYNQEVELAKKDMLIAAHKFNEVCISFLSVDHPDRKPLMVVPPFDWRNGPSEARYRELQSSLSDKATVLIDKYKKFVEVYKSEGFISDKI
ncbi:hypothetical protein CWC05_02430 [Pseudoalteromonas ruthenica]|uniref:Uncharacterized protein n=1 Tax=Pseudoalteromonas ruthenica TaxID=151081 RepID=A0A5S3Z7T4_9GAMM|nr:hypothetical protein [Pseudoalteromonas ruthenica]TMP88312.1 hypothetical protein CWC05_02430 [Pseudoalteromonas ruthenica]